MTFVLLTGIPRSGTTLAAALLDTLDDTVCLSEPDDHVELMQQAETAASFADDLHSLMEDTRRRLLRGEPVSDRRAPDGSPVTNYFSERQEGGGRTLTFNVMPRSSGSLSNDVVVAAKHNALYSAVLPELAASRHFRILTIVRDPVAVMKSWRSLDLPISSGRLPAADRFWEGMRDLTRSDQPLLLKQIGIYNLMCERFLTHRADIVLLRYEEIIADPRLLTQALERHPSAAELSRWHGMIDRRSSSALLDNEIEAAIRHACREGRAEYLLALYPHYG